MNDAIIVIITHVKRAMYSSKTEGSIPTLYCRFTKYCVVYIFRIYRKSIFTFFTLRKWSTSYTLKVATLIIANFNFASESKPKKPTKIKLTQIFPNLQYLVKALTKKTVNHERYKAMVTGKLEEFEKRWEILLGI